MKVDTWAVLQETGKEFMEDKVLRLSAALAYYALFSIGPLLIIVVGQGWGFVRNRFISFTMVLGMGFLLLVSLVYSSVILLSGAEFTQVYAKRMGSGIQPSRHTVSVTEGERREQGMPHTAAG